MLKGHSGLVMSAAFSPDGTHIVSGSIDDTVRLWDAVSGIHVNTLVGHSNTVRSVAFSSDGTRIVSGSYDDTLQLWDAVNGVHLDTLHKPTVSSYSYIAHSIACSLDPQQSAFESIAKHSTSRESGRRVGYIVDVDGWLCSVYPQRRICWVPVSCRPEDLAFSGSHIAFGTADGRVIIFDLQDLQLTPSLSTKHAQDNV
jgi:WD40 repeat protein